MGFRKFEVSIAVTSLLLFMGLGEQSYATTLSCASHSNAPAYLNTSGQWLLEAKVQSAFTLRDVKMQNRRKKDLGSESTIARYDRRINDARLFELKPDVFCNYELVLPRKFTEQATFNADLIMTCDDMYDGKATLNCAMKR